MHRKKATLSILVIAGVVAALAAGERAAAQTPLGSAFTYQGELADGGIPVNGPVDLTFRLYDAAALGKLIGTDGLLAVPVTDGRFTVTLDFGVSAFNGDRRWLEIDVDATTLSPRQEITVAPYALQTRGIFVDDNLNVAIVDGNIKLLTSTETAGNIFKTDPQSFPERTFLFLHNFGTSNTFLGDDAGNLTMSGSGNTGVGLGSLMNNTTGFSNSAFGGALSGNTTGFENSAFGSFASQQNTTGDRNSAFGRRASQANSSGSNNSAFGHEALLFNSTGSGNSAFGQNALSDFNAGSNNAAFGRNALLTNNGNNNIAVGNSAGANHNTGDNNIYIGHPGFSNESGRIRIGTGGTHTAVFFEGISNDVFQGSTLLINGFGQLGKRTSSIRFKEAVRDMEDASSVLMELRPVAFKYREAFANGDNTEQYGLIAEEVANVAPGLVQLDKDGKPFAVRYHLLSPMLLNEVQKQHRTIEDQASVIKQQKTRIDALEARLGKLESLLAEDGGAK